MAVQVRRKTKEVIICTNRRSFTCRLTQEDFDIQQAKVPRRARFIYMLGDTTDAELMFARVDATNDAAGAIEAHGEGRLE